MAKDAPTAAGGAHPLSDLLFSPRAAFIWNHTRKNVAWMNPAARAAFALRLEEFSASLPTSLIRRFGQCVERNEGGPVKVKIGRGPALACSAEILKLTDGQDGLIVAELAEDALRAVSRKTAKSTQKAVRKAAARSRRKPRKAPKAAPTLTAEEMRAFKAIGRKVLRLCEEKRDSEQPAAAEPPSPPRPPSPFENLGFSPEQAVQVLGHVLSAFDLVLFFGSGLDISRVEGRPARLGWRRAKLAGKSTADLLLPADQAALRRMVRALSTPGVKSRKNPFVVRGQNGDGKPCRAVVGRSENSATFFLALLSLESPARLKPPRPPKAMAAARLAA